MALPTNFIDDILSDTMNGRRRYRVINNSDGTISLEDVTEYEQTGSNFGAAQINSINRAVNDMSSVMVTLPASGWSADALPNQTVSVSWMTENWMPGNFVIIPSEDVEINKIMQREAGYISDIDTANGSVTVTCYSKAPTVDLQIVISGNVLRGE